MKKLYSILTSLIIFTFVISNAFSKETNINRIEVIVNDDIITNYDVIQRIKINAIIKGIDINSDNIQIFANTVIEELINEKLKLEKTSEYEITISLKEFEDHEKRFFNNLNLNKNELKILFKDNKINFNELKRFLESELKWQKLIYGLYLRVISVTDAEVSELTKNNQNITIELAKEILVQKQLDLKSNKLIKDLRDEATIEYRR
tara:strand:- start:799 stop:1413 length:615 start_codon:yes stop_codon:yes gene_type:complete